MRIAGAARALVWVLVPLSALWANLHGGFAAWLATLAILPLVSAAERNWPAVRRYASLTAACAVATLANPYGWHLHAHIAAYLRSSWILDNVQEFQSPRIRDENMLVFAALLLAGVALSSRALARRQWFEGALVLVWALAALRSARHVPLYAVVAAPVIASECACWWAVLGPGFAAGRCGAGLVGLGPGNRPLPPPGFVGGCLGRAGPVARAAAVAYSRFPGIPFSGGGGIPQPGAPDHSRARAHLRPVGRLPDLSSLPPPARVLRWPERFLRAGAGGRLRGAACPLRPQWSEILSRYDFDIALLPFDWPLGSVLERDPHWELVYRDRLARLFVRRAVGLKETRRTAECHVVGG